jgi:hypothetical protein
MTKHATKGAGLRRFYVNFRVCAIVNSSYFKYLEIHNAFGMPLASLQLPAWAVVQI